MKKGLSFLLIVSILLSLFLLTPVSAGAATSGSWEYKILDNGTAKITDYKGKGGDITIPSSLNGYKVTTLGWYALSRCEKQKNVTIPNTVTDIGYGSVGYYLDTSEWVIVSIKGCTITGGKGSAAEKYAKEKGFTFIVKGNLKTPNITKLQNVVGGIKITHSKVTGAAKYRIYRKTSGSSWKKLVDTTALSYTDKSVKSGTKYAYTVRCISKDGKKFTSSYNKTGKSLKYIAAPANPTLKNTSTGVRASWKKVTGAAKYRLYRKTSGSSWKKIGDTKGLTYTDKTVKKGTTYYFTVRCVTSDGKSAVSAYRGGKKITVPKAKASSSDSLRTYIKNNGSTNSDGTKYISGNVNDDDFAKVTLQSNNALAVSYAHCDGYGTISATISNIDVSKSSKANFKVLIQYDSTVGLKTTGTLNVKTNQKMNSNNVSIGYTKRGETYSRSDAKHFTYATLNSCLSIVNQLLESKADKCIRDAGFTAYPI